MFFSISLILIIGMSMGMILIAPKLMGISFFGGGRFGGGTYGGLYCCGGAMYGEDER